MVSMNDYLGINGFGMATAAEVDALNKALSAGYGVSPDTQFGGGAFRVESLENSLKVLTYSDQHVKLWKKIPKLPAYNTVEEYNQLISYGNDAGGFIGEGELPMTQDSSYQRRAAFVKFLGVTREVTHPMTLVRSSIGDVVARYNQDGILWLMQRLEHGLFWGNSQLGAGGSQFVEFDGLDNMIDAENVIDLAGNNLEEKHINWGAQMIVQNYGVPTDMFLPFEVMAQFSQEFFPKERVIMPTQGGYQAGVVVDKFQTHGGPVAFNPDIFLKKTAPLPTSATSTQAPAAPASVTAVLNNGATNGDFAKSGPGTYRYFVTLANRYGESVPVQCAADVVIGSGDYNKTVTVTITNPASSTFPADYAKIYRTEANGTQAFCIARIPLSANTAGAITVFTDTNYIMPNTYTAFMGELSEQVIAFKQLAPIMKMDLATLAPAYRWMILLYGVPVLYAPKKWMKFINIKADLYQGQGQTGLLGSAINDMNGARLAPQSGSGGTAQ